MKELKPPVYTGSAIKPSSVSTEEVVEAFKKLSSIDVSVGEGSRIHISEETREQMKKEATKRVYSSYPNSTLIVIHTLRDNTYRMGWFSANDLEKKRMRDERGGLNKMLARERVLELVLSDYSEALRAAEEQFEKRLGEVTAKYLFERQFTYSSEERTSRAAAEARRQLEGGIKVIQFNDSW